MSIQKWSLLPLAAGWLLATLGCGNVDAPTSRGEPLWTLHGRVDQVQKGLEVHALRAAILWDRDDHWVASQDVPVSLTGQLPVSFQIDFFAPPPEEVLRPASEFAMADSKPEWGEDFRGAGGILVLYDDVNGNGRIDLLPKEADQEIDRCLGPLNTWIEIFYIEGDPTRFNEEERRWCESLETAEERKECEETRYELLPGFNAADDAQDEAPIEPGAPFDLEIGYDPELQSLMCESLPEGQETLTEIEEGVPFEEVPDDVEIECCEDGRCFFYSSETITVDGGKLCGIPTIESSGGLVFLESDPPPAGWPCELTGDRS